MFTKKEEKVKSYSVCPEMVIIHSRPVDLSLKIPSGHLTSCEDRNTLRGETDAGTLAGRKFQSLTFMLNGTMLENGSHSLSSCKAARLSHY